MTTPTLPPEIEAAIDKYERAAIANAGALGAPDEHAAHTATWLALTSAITSALAAAREAGQREVLEGAAGVEEAIRDLVVAARDVESHSEEMTIRRRHVQAVEGLAAAQDAIRLAIAADKARAVEGLRPVLSREDAERLVNAYANAVNCNRATDDSPWSARAALLAALTGAGGGS